MEFIVLIIILAVRQLPGALPVRRHDRWFYRWVNGVCCRFRPQKPHLYQSDSTPDGRSPWFPSRWLVGSGPLFFAVILPVAALSLLLSVLETLLWGLPAFALSLLVLLYSLGRKESAFWLTRFQIAWRQQDLQGVYHYAAEILPKSQPPIQFADPSSNGQSLSVAVFDRLLLIRFRDLFLVLFWFILLGAEGALLVRLTLLFIEHRQSMEQADKRDDDSEKGDVFCYLLEWLPVRLLGGCFMLTGHFVNSSGQWLSCFFNRSLSHEQLLAQYARSALGEPATALGSHGDTTADTHAEDARLEALDQLLKRSAVLWVVCIAVFVITLK